MVRLTVTEIERLNRNTVHKPNEEQKNEVILTKDEIIDILKTLEGLKRRLQPHVR